MTNSDTVTQSFVSQMIETWSIRELIDEYPDLMPLLSQHGIDLCCGGGHTLAEAARLHGIELVSLAADAGAIVG